MDDQGWDELYRRTRTRLHAYARSRLPTVDEAEDAVAEAFLRAYQRPPATCLPVDAWLFGVLRNVIREMHRDRGRRQRGLPIDAAGPAEPPECGVLAAEEAAAIRAAFACLSEPDRELLRLRLFERLSTVEVADRLGKRPGAVRMAQSRAVARLRSLML